MFLYLTQTNGKPLIVNAAHISAICECEPMDFGLPGTDAMHRGTLVRIGSVPGGFVVTQSMKALIDTLSLEMKFFF